MKYGINFFVCSKRFLRVFTFPRKVKTQKGTSIIEHELNLHAALHSQHLPHNFASVLLCKILRIIKALIDKLIYQNYHLPNAYHMITRTFGAIRRKKTTKTSIKKLFHLSDLKSDHKIQNFRMF